MLFHVHSDVWMLSIEADGLGVFSDTSVLCGRELMSDLLGFNSSPIK